MMNLSVGRKKRYPTKRTINLMMVEKPSLRPSRSIPGVLAVLALSALFGKFAVADRLSAAYAAEARAVSRERDLAQVQERLKDYDTVALEYSRYFSDALGTPLDQMPLDCVSVLDLLSRRLYGKAEVTSVNFSGKIIQLELGNSGLENVSDLIMELYQEPSVESVAVSTANNGLRSQEEGTWVTMTITLQEVKAE